MLIDDFDELNSFDEGTFGPSPQNYFLPPNHSALGSASEDYNSEDYAMDTVRAPKPPLRSRPPINFPGLHSTASQSHMSGSTLHTFRKSYSTQDSQPKFSPEDIASLSVLELKYNPHFRKLQRQFALVSQTLATYIDPEPGHGDVAHDTGLSDIEGTFLSYFHAQTTLNKSSCLTIQVPACHLWGQVTRPPSYQSSTSRWLASVS